MPSDLGAAADRISRIARNERVARHAGFWWGLAEGILFFIVPDVYITFATLYSIRAGLVAWLFSIVGSLVAVCLIYVLVTVFGSGYITFLKWIPGIGQPLLEQTAVKIAADGLPYTPALVLGGVPLKVYAAMASTLGTSLGALLVWTVFARVVRIAPVFMLVALMRGVARRSVDAHPAAWLGAHIVSWIAFYVFYFYQMSRLA